MSARLALYVTPETDEALWQFGSSWLGYDAAFGAPCAHPNLPGIPVDLVHEATAHPRLYGLHITVKAPFRLAKEASADLVEAEIDALATRHSAFGPFGLTLEARETSPDHVFLCLVPRMKQEALHALEMDAVLALDRFRAPLTPSEIARRNPDRLAARERRYLDKHGYPYVLDAFRPHISLTGQIPADSPIRRALEDHLTERADLMQLACRTIALFEQPEPGARFRIRRRFALRPA
jgi:hypothetical protein